MVQVVDRLIMIRICLYGFGLQPSCIIGSKCQLLPKGFALLRERLFGLPYQIDPPPFSPLLSADQTNPDPRAGMIRKIPQDAKGSERTFMAFIVVLRT